MKKIFEHIKELKSSSIGKAILFFGFYFIFFFIIAIVARLGGGSYTSSDDYEKSSSFVFSYGNFAYKNFKFTYNIYLDDSTYAYTGSKNDDIESFKYNDKEYYFEENYYVKNNSWEKCDNPYKFNLFLDVDSIISIIGSSYLESKTSYESGKIAYNFFISSNTLNKLLENKDTDFEEEPNKIVVSQNENNDIEKITYYLNSYCTLNKLCDKSLKIEAFYEDYGKIKDIDIPIDSLEN